jgi:peptidyl-prolyl cis-trans isomerase C
MNAVIIAAMSLERRNFFQKFFLNRPWPSGKSRGCGAPAKLWLCLAACVLAACGGGVAPLPSPQPPAAPTLTTEPSPSPTVFQPNPTSLPLAARVNGEGLPLAQYEAELERFQSAAGAEITADDQQRVLDDLIDELLLAQGAVEAGFKLDEAGLQARIDALSQELGGLADLERWQAENGYTAESFRESLRRSSAAAWMRDRIAAGVPETVEQVHARQVLFYNAEQAAAALARLEAGIEFAALAAEADPLTRGDLGWFPRGYLLDGKLEEAAFGLQPGETSPVIETEVGYHILQVIEREAERPLDPDARLKLQVQALQDWLEVRRSESQIEILAP